MTAINNQTLSFIPKEIPTAAIGVTLASASGVAMQYLAESYFTRSCEGISKIALDFVYYGCGASVVAGVVMAIYSMIMLCKKSISKENGLQTSITATALGVLGTAITQSLGEYFWRIAPCFWNLEGSSLAYAIATNFAWQAFAVTGMAAIVVAGYAAYRVGVTILTQQQIPKLAEE